ncbi:MAG: T9SS type A sorting domain-containing protein, partial [Candidatus Delongbacteria bacterium]|nr:T9SS type A sorting domain-containing protein [Candidatus Delongbacteria bacterium]
MVNSDGSFKSNTIRNYEKGMEITLCSPILTRNSIKDNINYGLYITGYNANPQLINPLTTKIVLNNQIMNNGIGTLYNESAQIFMKFSANAYMSGGYNNIYSGTAGTIPTIPCIRAVSNYFSKESLPLMTYINAQYNYWGYSAINESIFNKFFYIWADGTSLGYILLYEPFATVPYRSNLPTPSPTPVPMSPETKLLSNAIKLEQEGKFVPAIKLYENIIDKYEGSTEYYVALIRLPDIYIKQEMELETLLALFDAEIYSEDDTNKKFFKEMRVSTHIKGKKYDIAIHLGEEMKAEAQCEGEVLLAEIDITVAKIMKASGSEKCDIVNYLSDLNLLLDKLKGDDKIEITKNNLPTEFKLYQNYPNPFNPTTIIKYDIPKEGHVKMSVYNTKGELITKLIDGQIKSGYHQVVFDASNYSNGIYYYSLQVNGKSFGTKKMAIIK